ncbi:MAG: glycosyltransferase family 4 protein [Holosporales bacterium]
MKLIYLVADDQYFCSHRLPLALAAQKAGYDVRVATVIKNHGPAIEQAGLKVIALKHFKRRLTGPWQDTKALLELYYLYKSERPDVVHQVAIKPSMLGTWAARLAGVPRIINAFGGLGFIFTSQALWVRLLRFGLIQVMRLLFHRPQDRLILQNPDDAAVLTGLGVITPQQITLIRGAGVDTTQLHPVTPPTTPPVIVTLACRMLKMKGVEDLLEAIKLLHQRGVNAEFHFLGDVDPSNPASLSREVLLQAEASGLIRWFGHVSNVAHHYQHSHVAVLPSRGGEGIPKSLLEAAAVGLPIVTTDTPGCREAVRDGFNGFLVPPAAPTELARALEALITDPQLRQRMGEASRTRAVAEFEVSKVIAATLELYHPDEGAKACPSPN